MTHQPPAKLYKSDRSVLDYRPGIVVQSSRRLPPRTVLRSLSRLTNLRVLYLPRSFPDIAHRLPPGCFATLEHVHMPINPRLYRQLVSRCPALQRAEIFCPQCEQSRAWGRSMYPHPRAMSQSAYLDQAETDRQHSEGVRASAVGAARRLGGTLRRIAGTGQERDPDPGALSPSLCLRYLTIESCSGEPIEDVYSLDLCPSLDIFQIDYQEVIMLERVVSPLVCRMTMNTS